MRPLRGAPRYPFASTYSLLLVFKASKNSLLPVFARQLGASLTNVVHLLLLEIQDREDNLKDVFIFFREPWQLRQELCHDLAHVLQCLFHLAVASPHLVGAP